MPAGNMAAKMQIKWICVFVYVCLCASVRVYLFGGVPWPSKRRRIDAPYVFVTLNQFPKFSDEGKGEGPQTGETIGAAFGNHFR